MMNVINRCEKLMSPAFKCRVLLEQTGVFRSAGTGRYHSPCLPRRYTTSLFPCQRWHHVNSVHSVLYTNRFYSEMCSESSESSGANSKRSTGVIQEESHETETNCHQRSSPTFTLDVLVSLLRQENAGDICVIKVPEQIKYSEYFIVASGTSPRHLRAMALYAIKVYKFLKNSGDPNVKIEGKDADDWMCVDFGNMVVHFMLPETREVYELEKLWTLRTFDEQLKKIPAEVLPEDFIYDLEVTK